MQNIFFFIIVRLYFLFTELYMRFSYGHKTERIERGETNFQTKTKQSDRKLRKIGSGHLLKPLFFFLRVIGHFPFRTGEIVALDVFNVDVVVFVFQFARIGGSVLVPFAAALELVRL